MAGDRKFFRLSPDLENKIFILDWGKENGAMVRFDPSYWMPNIYNEKLKGSKCLVKKIKDVLIDIKSGTTPKETDNAFEESVLYFIRNTDLKNGVVDFCNAKTINEKTFNKYNTLALTKNDVLVCIAGTIGASSIYDNDKEAIFNQNISRLRFTQEILPEYANIYFNTAIFQNIINQNATQATIKYVNNEILGNLPIPIPNQKNQKEIIKIIRSAQTQKRQKEAQAQNLLNSIDDFVLGELGIKMPKAETNSIFTISSEEIQGRIDPLFFHPLRLLVIKSIKKSNCQTMSLNEIAKFHREITSDIPENTVYIGLENIVSNSGAYIETEVKESVSSAFIFKKGDILFPKLHPYLNKVFYANFDGICSTEFHVLKAIKCDPFFLFSFLTRSIVIEQTSKLMTGNTLPRLQTEDVENLLIPIPPEDIQQKIASAVKTIYAQAKTLKQEAESLICDAQKQVERMIFET